MRSWCAEAIMWASFVHALRGSGARVTARLWTTGNGSISLSALASVRKLLPVGLLGDDYRKSLIFGAFLGRGSHISYLKVDLRARLA